ncbi:MAG: hypothetical protein RLZZ241_1073 [Bacteroidota bacterium]|jgi:hypothetical protein
MKNQFRILTLICILLKVNLGLSQNLDLIHPERLQNWNAKWISHPEDNGTDFGIFHFKKEIALDVVPERFVVHISADNRYKLYVNGTYITFGPARGDQLNWRYESLDLAPYLKTGKNTLAATVWNFGVNRPVAQHAIKTGLIVQGNTDNEEVVNTDQSWRVTRDFAYSPLTTNLNAYYVVGPGEEIWMDRHPVNWMNSNETPAAFVVPREGETGRPTLSLERFGNLAAHVLVPRTIPLMEESQQRFAAIREQSGIAHITGFLSGNHSIDIPKNSSLTLLLDQGHLTNAFPELQFSGGKGSEILITYAESLFASDGNKYNRNETAGKLMIGGRDLIHPDGGANRIFESLWWRTFRYVELKITTADAPLTLHDFTSRFTGYPLEERATFASDRADLTPIWEVGWRTQRLCAGENYFDCPYYEQLQYAGDTRIQCLISTYVSGDTRLFKNALLSYRDSKLPFGLTQSRYPSYDPQIIPTFSLVWITMIHDYWMLTPDSETVKALVPEILSVLEWYDRHIDNSGLLGKMEYWNFVDWVEEDGWQSGVPPGVRDSHSTLISLQYVYTLQKAIALLSSFGYPEQAKRFQNRVASIQNAARVQSWDTERQLFADTPEKTYFSQHTNALAILTDTAPIEDQKALMERLLSQDSVAETTYYFSFYRTEALAKSGMANTYLEGLGPWQEMLDLGLTTFAEEPDPTRSDCHAWSASPLYHFLSLVCGVRPDSPGFQTVRIAPNLNALKQIEAKIPHALGDLTLKIEQQKDEELIGKITLPEGLTGNLDWEGQSYPLKSGSNSIQIKH